MKITIWNPFTRPITYVHWKENICLYVGQSGQGLSRPFSNGHKMWDRRKEITQTDIYYSITEKDALELEKKLTRELKPIHDESHLAQRMGKVPMWALDDSKIKELVNRCFPFGGNRPHLAARMVRVIHLYYRLGDTAAAIGEQLKMTEQAVDQLIRRANKTINRPMKPRGRPRKS